MLRYILFKYWIDKGININLICHFVRKCYPFYTFILFLYIFYSVILFVIKIFLIHVEANCVGRKSYLNS